MSLYGNRRVPRESWEQRTPGRAVVSAQAEEDAQPSELRSPREHLGKSHGLLFVLFLPRDVRTSTFCQLVGFPY